MICSEVSKATNKARRDSTEQAEISVIIPVYNEVATVQQVVEKVRRVTADGGWDCEILVVDDGSRDGTSTRIAGFANGRNIRSLVHEKNRGKGAAIRTALAAATRPLTVIQDADLEYDPQDISALIDAMNRHHADVVYGSRVLGAQSGRTRQRWNVYGAGVLGLNLAVRLLYGLRITDEATCYKMFRTADLRRMELECERFEFCPEVTAKAARLGLRVVEAPIGYNPRSTAEGKKVRFRDAVCAIQTLWKHRRWTPSSAAAE